EARDEARYYQDQLMVAGIDCLSYAKYRAQQASSERTRSHTHSVESTGGHRALRHGQGEATSSRRPVLVDVPVGTQPPPMMGGEMLAGHQTGAEE
ncbi:hypothetical protein KI387_015073, partial [Taxus chinensis]